MKPKYYNEDGNAVFTTSQIDYLGAPEENGFFGKYYVVETNEDVVYKPTFQDELKLNRNIHRYDRLQRFKTVIGQLTGAVDIKTRKSLVKIEELKYQLTEFDINYTPPCLIWEMVRNLLKNNGLSQFYNRIPAVASIIGLQKVQTKITSKQWNRIMEDFCEMHFIFKRMRHRLKRKYFPSLRFIALCLLKRNGVKLALHVPMARTTLKKKLLDSLYDGIWGEITEEYEQSLI